MSTPCFPADFFVKSDDAETPVSVPSLYLSNVEPVACNGLWNNLLIPHSFNEFNNEPTEFGYDIRER